MATLVAGLVLFLAPHSVRIFADDWRAARIAAWGERPWKIAYTIVSIVGFVLIVVGYGAARTDPVWLYMPPTWTKHAAALLTLPAFILIVAAYVKGTRIKARVGHPMLAGVKLWAFAHLVSNGTLADVLLFGGFLVWAAADRVSFRWRPVRAIRTAPERPYIDLIAVAVGLALYLFFAFYLHVRWIGVSPV